MVSKTNEQALEAAIELALTGSCQEYDGDNAASDFPQASYAGTHHNFYPGLPGDFDKAFALDTHYFWDFLQRTQNDELAQLQKFNPTDWQRKLLERYDRLIKKHGVIHLLKKGLSVDQCHFDLLYPAPLASSSDRIRQNFAHNTFSCTRQLQYSSANPGQEIDMVLFVNGMPLVTLELKNHWTGQTARYHGIRQYKSDRDPSQPLLNFARCLVHMAVDTEEVYMTTRLAGQATRFLPFNRGNNHGQGNPPNPAGHRTAYLWQDIFSRESLANIIQHFVRLDGSSKQALSKRTLFFPRFHQLDVVRKLIADVSANGAGRTYLIQHSAGSGKSNSITWAAYQLIEAYPASADAAGTKDLDQPLFDSVIVVTDRRLLDRQLRENIKAFSEVQNIVAPAFKSAELKRALEVGKKIIITTIQKFPFIVDGITDLSDKRFAVIIDEAHSSQSGIAHDNMNRAMGQAAVDDEEDVQDKILAAMQSRKMRSNASYFAFTATPKNSTLEKFGDRQADGRFQPFHLYSMKQAIEEGFILDVIANYTTYKSYYEIQKSIHDNPEFDTRKAQAKLRAFVEGSQQTIDSKAEVMLEHFISKVVNSKKLKGKAKGMVATQSIQSAIRYYNAITRLLDNQGNPFQVAIAFSGSKTVDGIDYTEAGMNGFADTDTRDQFDTDAYRLLVVANKYLTGFDQPKLCTMYVDKKLAGVQCVQALSRLNRSAPALNKRSEDMFVLDFFNTVDDIQHAFEPFYTATTLSEATDVNVLNDLKDAMDEVGVYEWREVEHFVARYFNNEDAQTLSTLVDVAVQRFDHDLELADEDKADFKIKAKQFVKIYGQMAAIMPYEVVAWEKLFWFLKFLVPKLKIKLPGDDQLDELLESVDLSSYGLQRVKLNQAITLAAEEAELDPQNPNPRGVRGGPVETDPLDAIVQTFNERWFQGWSATPEEQRIKFINIAESIRQHPDYEPKYKNNPDPHTRELAFDKMLQDIMLRRRKDELELYKLFAGDPAFKTAWTRSMQDVVARQ